MKRPLAIFYAGTNGSGKSTIRADDQDEVELHIDPDMIARQLNPQDPRSVDLSAGREAARQYAQAIAHGISFSMETTLTGNTILRRLKQAREAGFNLKLRYVGLESPALNIDRVASRVSKGGHHIDEADIRRRYVESFKTYLTP